MRGWQGLLMRLLGVPGLLALLLLLLLLLPGLGRLLGSIRCSGGSSSRSSCRLRRLCAPKPPPLCRGGLCGLLPF